MEEQKAIALLQRGDLRGLETLVGLFYDKAVRVSYLIVGDLPLAEDVVQSAFLNVKERINQFDSNHAFAPWFFRSVANASIKACAEQKRMISLNQKERLDIPSWEERLVDPHPGPEEHVLTAERRQAIQAAIERLSPNQRAAVVLHYYLELDEGKIAAELKSPRSSVKWWLRTAKDKLQRFLIGFRNTNPQPNSDCPSVRPKDKKEEISHE